MAEAQRFGREMFHSAEYAARNRSDEQFVHDMYYAWQQRPADEEGYHEWVRTISGSGREHVIDGFADGGEFAGRVGALCAGMQTEAVIWQLTDQVGSVRMVMSESGAVQEIHDTAPFGDEINWGAVRATNAAQAGQTSAADTVTSTGLYGWNETIRARYATLERDTPTGLEHTQWRKYDGWQGRWTTTDPSLASMSVGDPQSLNRYSYVQNDPVNGVDLTGLCTFNININGSVNDNQRQAMESEITRIFNAANQSVVFNHPEQSNGGSYVTTLLNSESNRNALGYTNPGSNGSIANYGGIFVGALRNNTDADSSFRALARNSTNLGRAIGRVASHEAGHFLLQLSNSQHTPNGLMRAQYSNDRNIFLESTGSSFQFSPEQAQQLSSLCLQLPAPYQGPTQIPQIVPPPPPPSFGGGGGGGGRDPMPYFGGGFGGFGGWTSIDRLLLSFGSGGGGGGRLTEHVTVRVLDL